MDDKKKNVPEETKELKTGAEEIVEFDDIRSALDKLEAKKASLEQEKKEKEALEKTKEEKDVKKEEEKDNSKTDSTDKESVEKGNKNEETSKKDDDSSKDASEVKQIIGVVEDVKDDKKDSEKNKADKKENADGEKTSKKDNKDTEKKESDEKNSEKKDAVSNKAITQSKRLAEAKAAKAAKVTETSKEEGPVVINNTKEKKSKKGIGIFFGIVAALVVVVYIAGFVYFSNYFYPDVAINGTNVSNMDKATAQKTIDDFNKQYVLTLETIDGKQVTIAGTDIEMTIKLHDEFDNCLKQQKAYLWFMNFMNHHDYTIGADATWNADALEKLFSEMKMLDKKLMTAPKDAYIGVENDAFAIVKEDLGTTIIVDTFKNTVQDSLSGVVANVNLMEAGCYELPKVYSDDETLNKDFNAMSEYVGGVIKLQLDDLTLEPGMELYNTVLEKNGDSYTVSKTKVQAYVKDLAAQYDTMGKDRNFTSSYENNRMVKISGTAFGYEMDQEATANALYSALEAKKSATVEAVFKTKGYTLQGENDIGDTYIEVNLSLQKVIAYKDGKKIVEGDCVSGCEANGNGTCLGLYAIQDKLSPTVLRGQQKQVTKTVTKKNKKGKTVKVKKTSMEYEYESPVTFWLQFNGGYGLHDAAGWRSVYGGSIYYYSGSHGCVNLPYDVAEKLYQNFAVGDPVVVYFWDNENRK